MRGLRYARPDTREKQFTFVSESALYFDGILALFCVCFISNDTLVTSKEVKIISKHVCNADIVGRFAHKCDISVTTHTQAYSITNVSCFRVVSGLVYGVGYDEIHPNKCFIYVKIVG